MNVGDRVRIAQDASQHCGEMGTVVAVDGYAVTVVIIEAGCVHMFADTEIETGGGGPHRYDPRTVKILDHALMVCMIQGGDATLLADFEALSGYVKANLA